MMQQINKPFGRLNCPITANDLNGFILALKSGLTAFDQIFALTSGGPNNATTSLGLLVYNYAFKSNQYGYADTVP